MAKQKLEMTKKLSGNGIYSSKDFTISIGEEIVDLKDKLQMFDGEIVKFSFALSDILAESNSE